MMMPAKLRLAHWRSIANRAVKLSDSMQSASDSELRRRSREVRWRIKTGQPLKRMYVEFAALVRETSRRKLGMAHYPVQLMGGLAMLEGFVAQMQTGEGKTITALLPAFARALEGKGCHVLTSNDYLAERDAEELQPVYNDLGLSVGCVTNKMSPDERRTAYAKDVTYGTAKEMGFDFLRDRIALGVRSVHTQSYPYRLLDDDQSPVQRGHHFALIDEADALLIDEATTPLIISVPQPADHATVALYRWCQRVSERLDHQEDFEYDPHKRSARLTESGCRRVLLTAMPSLMSGIETERIYSQTENAVLARIAYQRDRNYMLSEEKVVIVDESTGRVMDGRKWQDGMHQAIEAKEQLPITGGTGSAAQVTTQTFFKLYTYLAGMTGTAASARTELRRTFKLRVADIPTHRRRIRIGFAPRVFATLEAKNNAVVQEIMEMLESGRPVLVGTPSIEASEALGQVLNERQIKHRILNAKFHELEAEIISQAGQSGQVTIATNMAGRGTDIKLNDLVRERGGLHVIATEMHSSPRTDRQLIGRCARQGDPGSFRFYTSLEDELLLNLSEKRRKRLQRWAGLSGGSQLPRLWLPLFRRTQRKIERNGRKGRKGMLRHEKQRKKDFQLLGLDLYLEFT